MFEQVVPCCLSYQGLLLLLVFFLTLYVGSRFLLTDAFVPDLDKKAVFITGCDTGFGFELAKKLDRLGLRVFASCLSTEGQTKLTNLCSKHLTTLRMDVTVEEDVKNALEFVKCRLPPQGLWAIVNNAGILMSGFVEWTTMDDMKKVVDVNLWGTVSVTRAFLPLLKQTKGRIVNVASAFGIVSVPGAVSYAISKYGVEAFCDGLRREIKHLGVTVHIIEPGCFSTNLSDLDKNMKTMAELWHHLDEETRQSYGNEFFEQMISKGERMYRLMISPHNHKVVDAMANAALCRRPKLRYSVGVDHKIFWRPVSFLPAEIQDLFF